MQVAKETSRPHPFKKPEEQRLPSTAGPRGVGRTHPARPPACPALRAPSARAPSRPARAQSAGARSGLLARAPAPLTRLAAAAPGGDAEGEEGWGAEVAGDSRASPRSRSPSFLLK